MYYLSAEIVLIKLKIVNSFATNFELSGLV